MHVSVIGVRISLPDGYRFEHHLSPRRAMITSTATIIAIPVLAKLAKQAVSSTLLLASLGVLTGSALLHIAIVAEWTSAWGGHIFGFAWGDLFLAASILLTAWRVSASVSDSGSVTLCRRVCCLPDSSRTFRAARMDPPVSRAYAWGRRRPCQRPKPVSG